MVKPFVIKESDIEGYSPANHTGTLNKRLISQETVGAKSVEMLLGTIEPGQGAQKHSHPGIEQICYLLEGKAIASVGNKEQEMEAGDCCFFHLIYPIPLPSLAISQHAYSLFTPHLTGKILKRLFASEQIQNHKSPQKSYIFCGL